ncbi:hypothetical protein [Hyphomonas sp.]|jgi:hypothetical protein|uniref:hypothetical protein n=1 Tax=Hyphomonas sp. TaxID=87 RepID=UPI0039E5CDDA
MQKPILGIFALAGDFVLSAAPASADALQDQFNSRLSMLNSALAGLSDSQAFSACETNLATLKSEYEGTAIYVGNLVCDVDEDNQVKIKQRR